MNVSALFITRPVTTTLIMLGLLLFGAMAYRQLPVSDLPNVDFPVISVSASLPGASPETMASSIALPLEKQFAGISGLTSMTSSSQQGLTRITLQFDLNRNIDAAAQDVQSTIAKTRLPPQMPAPPSLPEGQPGTTSRSWMLGMNSPTLADARWSFEYAQTILAQRISMVSGVAAGADSAATMKYAVRIDVDPKQAGRAYGIGIDEVGQGDCRTPTPTFRPERSTVRTTGRYTVQADGQLLAAAGYAFRQSMIAYRKGQPGAPPARWLTSTTGSRVDKTDGLGPDRYVAAGPLAWYLIGPEAAREPTRSQWSTRSSDLLPTLPRPAAGRGHARRSVQRPARR